MSDWVTTNHERVAQIFCGLGADSARAAIMSKQLLRRAEQLAAEQSITELEATETLLKKVIEARRGS